MTIKHKKQSTLSDGVNADLVQPSNWNDDHEITGGIVLPGVDAPVTPAADQVLVFGRKVGGRMLPAFMGPSGLDSALQVFLGRNKLAWWNPSGNSTTVPGVCGLPALTFVGTATARNVATTSFFTRMKRAGYVSAATAGSMVSGRSAAAQYTTGTGDGLNGGFHTLIRFGCSDAATVAGARQFVGMSSSQHAATNVEPSTLTNVIGCGHGAADSNLQVYISGSSSQTPIDLGANFPANTLSVDAYEFAAFSPAGENATVYWQVTRLNTGHTASGAVTGNPGVNTPNNATLLTCLQGWRSNNAAALAVALDFMGLYVDQDN